MKVDQVTTLYRPYITPSVTLATDSFAHAHIHLCMFTVPNSNMEIVNILKLLLDAQGLGQWAADS